MKFAVAISMGRVAPVFDTSRRIKVIELVSGRPVSDEEVDLPATGGAERATALVRLNVDTLICGAITHELSASIKSRGVQVLALVSGDIDRVVEAFLAGTLYSGAFCMPGCSCVRHRCRDDFSGDEP